MIGIAALHLARLGQGENAQVRRRVRELEGETRYLAHGDPEFRRGDALVNRFQFAARDQPRYGVMRLCRILEVAR
jgi:hypothetical protein